MNLILDILFPKKCVSCKREGAYFCRSCVRNILQTDLVCPRCDRLAVGGITHPICKRKFGLDGLWSLGVYQEPLRSAIQSLKYRYIKNLADTLADLMIKYWVSYQPLFLDQIKLDLKKGWVVVPVPLHWYRKNWRGFNQSSLIGKSLADKIGLEYAEVLNRKKYTKPQTKLKGYDRQKNIRNAFGITSNYTLHPTPYILLLDDVWTTGSTMKECCYVLKRSGAKRVWAITLAR